MARSQTEPVVNWLRCKGRNGYDVPAELPDDMAVEARNIVIVRGTIGQKRYGSSTRTFTGDSFSGYNYLARFVPGQNDAAAELIWVSRDGTPKIMRVAAGTAAAALTLSENIASLPQETSSATLNGKLYLAYDSSVNRLHVFDPTGSTTTVRKVGLKAPAAPTAANTGAGSYAATLRYYQIQGLVKSGSNVRLASNLGTALSFTPSGTGTAARVTAPSFTEGETHWRVYGSEDDTVYYLLSTSDIVVATTTYDDSVAPTDYADGDAAPPVGAFTPWPSVKFVLSTGERLVGLGVWETSTGDAMPPKAGRVYFSPVLDSSEAEDDERVSNSLSQKGYIDIGRNSGAEDRALVGPMDGQIFAFQSRGIYMLVPTSNAQTPYRRITLSSSLGAVNHWSSFVGEDEFGRPCIYFLDPERGPYRYGAGGFQWLGYDIQDIWSTVNLSATNRVAVGEFDMVRRRCIWLVATGSSNDPDKAIVFYAREGRNTNTEGVRYGWTTWDGDICAARTMVMFAETFGATMSRRLKPYMGFSNKLLKTDDSTKTTDDTTAFRAYLTSKAYGLEPIQTKKTIHEAWVQAATASGVDIELAVIRNYGDISEVVEDQPLTPSGSETRILKRYSDAELADAWSFQMRVGDASAVSNNWQVDRVVARVDPTTELVGNNMP
jgi:hypothetical protein